MKTLILIMIAGMIAFSQSYSLTNVSQTKKENLLIENKGQWDKDIKFAAKMNGLNMLVMTDGILFDYFIHPVVNDKIAKLKGHIIKMKLNNANYFFNNEGLEQSQGYCNYFRGNDPAKWISDVKMFRGVKLNNVYNGVDLIIGFEDSKPRYDFMIYPGANPEQVDFSFEGIENYQIDLSGNLQFSSSIGELIHGRIYAYQNNFGTKTQIPCFFEKRNNRIGFKVGEYDRTKPLIIDPLVMVSFFGADMDEEINKVAYIKDGSFVVTGWTTSSAFRTTPGAYDTVFKYLEDIFISKFTFKGTNQTLDFSTFIGGASSDIASSITTDPDQNIYITGWSTSTDYPMKSAFQPELIGNTEAIISKISKDGKSLLYSSFIGGGKNDYGMDITVGPDQYAYICGYTNSSDFPTTAGTYQRALKGLDDIFLSKISPTGNSIKFSTYIGGTVNDRAYGIYVDNENSVYLTGETNSGDMPVVPFSNQGTQPWDRPYSASLMGGYDAFVIKITGEGSSIVNGTYFGGSSDDRGIAIQVDEDYYTMFIAGITQKESGTAKFPVTNNAVSKTNQGGWDCFYAQLEKVKPQAGTGKRQNLLFSTFFGGTGDDMLQDMVYDKNSAGTYFTGMTSSPKFPVIGEQAIKLKGKDAFITKFNVSGSEIIYSTLLGGTSEDCGNTVAVDERGDIIVCGYTKSTDLPQINNQIQPTYGGGTSDAFIAKVVFGELMLSAPSGNEHFCPTSSIVVGWNSSGFAKDEKYTIQLGRKSENTWLNIGTDVQGSLYSWSVPAGFPTGKDYFIRVVTNSGLFATHGSPFSILQSPSIKDFSSIPSDATVCEGDTVRIIITATGDALKYSWFMDGIQFQNQTDSVLVLNTTIFNKSGKITASVSGTCSPLATSKEIYLTVKPATKIISQSDNSKVRLGKNLTLFVETRGLNLKYEWFKDGSKVLGFEDSTFSINGASESHKGTYKCIVTGDCGTVNSNDIVVTIDTSTSVNESNSENSEHLSIVMNQSLAQNTINFTVKSELSGFINLKMINLNGNAVSIIKNENIESGNYTYTIDISAISTGTYLIVAESSGERAISKIQIIK